MFENACYFPPSLFCHRCATCKLRLENKIGRLITWPTAPWGCTTKYFFSSFMSLQAKMPSATTATCHMCTKNMHPLDQLYLCLGLSAFYGHRARKKCGICGPKGIARLQVPYHLDASPPQVLWLQFQKFSQRSWVDENRTMLMGLRQQEVYRASTVTRPERLRPTWGFFDFFSDSIFGRYEAVLPFFGSHIHDSICFFLDFSVWVVKRIGGQISG